jgi:hypothetical protein
MIFIYDYSTFTVPIAGNLPTGQSADWKRLASSSSALGVSASGIFANMRQALDQRQLGSGV